jgi:hypothetical protein
MASIREYEAEETLPYIIFKLRFSSASAARALLPPIHDEQLRLYSAVKDSDALS